jgi:hypothetical protein
MTTAIQTRPPTPARDALLECRAKIELLDAKLAMAISEKSRQKIYDEYARLAFTEVRRLESASSDEYRRQRAERWLAQA